MIQATIIVGGVSIDVEMLDSQNTRKISARIVDDLPSPVAQWPISAAEIQERAQRIFDASGCRPMRDDIVWAINKAGIEYAGVDGRYYFHAVPTPKERRENIAAARAEAKDGLV